jgi:hypothetical protein
VAIDFLKSANYSVTKGLKRSVRPKSVFKKRQNIYISEVIMMVVRIWVDPVEKTVTARLHMSEFVKILIEPKAWSGENIRGDAKRRMVIEVGKKVWLSGKVSNDLLYV